MTQFISRLAVRPDTQKKAAILASKAVRWQGFEVIGELVDFFVTDAWQEAKLAGKVTDAMLEPVKEKEIA